MGSSVVIFSKEGMTEQGEIELLGQGTELPVDVVRRNMGEFLEALSQIFSDRLPGILDYELGSISVSVGIDGKGTVGFLGTGAELGASGTVTLEFKKVAGPSDG